MCLNRPLSVWGCLRWPWKSIWGVQVSSLTPGCGPCSFLWASCRATDSEGLESRWGACDWEWLAPRRPPPRPGLVSALAGGREVDSESSAPSRESRGLWAGGGEMGLTSTDRPCGPPAFLLHLLPSRVFTLSPAPLLPFHSSCPAPTWAASWLQSLSVRGGRDRAFQGLLL